MSHGEEYEKSIVTDWDEMQDCIHSKKAWVNPKDVNTSKSYEKGDFLRVWCNHNLDWCEAETGFENCGIYQDHEI